MTRLMQAINRFQSGAETSYVCHSTKKRTLGNRTDIFNDSHHVKYIK